MIDGTSPPDDEALRAVRESIAAQDARSDSDPVTDLSYAGGIIKRAAWGGVAEGWCN